MRLYCVKFKHIKMAILFLLVIVTLSVNINGYVPASVFFNNGLREVPVYYVSTDTNKVAISFDAAWGADKTEKIMEICDEYGIKATFFLVGFWVEEHPELVKKIDEKGFEIGTHSNTHPDMTKLSKEQMKIELETSCNLIKNITNKDVSIFRAPYGAYNDTLINTARELNLVTVQWDVDSLDWKGLSAGEITNRVLNGVRNGSIILCHNNSDHILEALPLMLDRLQKRGYEITTVGNVIYKKDFVVDNNGMQSQKI